MRTLDEATPTEQALWNQFSLFMCRQPEQLMEQLLHLTTLAQSLMLDVSTLHLHELANLSEAFPLIMETLHSTFIGEEIPIRSDILSDIKARAQEARDTAAGQSTEVALAILENFVGSLYAEPEEIGGSLAEGGPGSYTGDESDED